jgi:hypothetical protein
MNIESCFSGCYAEAREKFRVAALAAGARLDTYLNPRQGPSGETLATDVARLGPATAGRILVTMSATHGAEGFCGSGLQTAWFESGLARELPEDTALVVIHAINPYGFAWLRRVTEDNIDLNRNFIDYDEDLPENPGYDELADAICPRDWSDSSRVAAEHRLQEYGSRFGAAALQKAISGGQYRHSDGIFYGGDAPSWSRETLACILAKELRSAQQVALIDFHTGLGPYGYGEAIASHAPNGAGFARACAWFADKVTSTRLGSSSSADITGDNLDWIERSFPDIAFTGIALEFGTRPLHEVFNALRADNWLHLHGELDSPAGRAIKHQMRDCFYCDKADWKDMLFEQAVDTQRQALRGLSE